MTRKELSDLILALKLEVKLSREDYEYFPSQKNLEALQDAEDELIEALNTPSHL